MLAEPAALPAAQRWLCEAWRQLGLPADRRTGFELALEEVFINSATHGRTAAGHPLTFRARLRELESGIELKLSDDAPPFNPLKLATPDLELPLAARPTGGVGIVLLRQLMDRLSYRRVGGLNELRLWQALERSGNERRFP